MRQKTAQKTTQKTTHVLFYALLFLGVGGGIACRASDASIMVTALRPLDADCKADTNHYVGRGALNLSVSSEYLLSVVIESVVEGADVEGSGGRLLSSEKENRVVLTEWKRQTFLYGAGGTSKFLIEESEPIAGILEPNAQMQLLIPVSMLGPGAARELRQVLLQAGAGLPLGAPPPGVEVVVRFQIKGKLMSSGKKIETAPVEFPIFAYLGAPLPQCLENESLAPVGPCGLYGGQDGFQPICCELDPISRKCKS